MLFRCDVKDEFEKLIKNKEIVISKKDSFEIPRLQLTDYNYATPSIAEQQHYIDFLLESQVDALNFHMPRLYICIDRHLNESFNLKNNKYSNSHFSKLRHLAAEQFCI